jgi:hypothetical protein
MSLIDVHSAAAAGSADALIATDVIRTSSLLMTKLQRVDRYEEIQLQRPTFYCTRVVPDTAVVLGT